MVVYLQTVKVMSEKRDPFVARYNTNNEYNKDIVDIKSAPL